MSPRPPYVAWRTHTTVLHASCEESSEQRQRASRLQSSTCVPSKGTSALQRLYSLYSFYSSSIYSLYTLQFYSSTSSTVYIPLDNTPLREPSRATLSACPCAPTKFRKPVTDSIYKTINVDLRGAIVV